MATAEVIGFEGGMDEKSIVGWGCAAVRCNELLINGTTGFKRKYSDEYVRELASKGSITIIKPMEIDAFMVFRPLVCLRINNEKKFSHLLSIKNTSAYGIIAKNLTPSKYSTYVFHEPSAFEVFAKRIVRNIIDSIIYDRRSSKEIQKLLSISVVLDHDNPEVHAMRVVHSPNKKTTKRIASTIIKAGKGDLQLFESKIIEYENLFNI